MCLIRTVRTLPNFTPVVGARSGCSHLFVSQDQQPKCTWPFTTFLPRLESPAGISPTGLGLEFCVGMGCVALLYWWVSCDVHVCCYIVWRNHSGAGYVVYGTSFLFILLGEVSLSTACIDGVLWCACACWGQRVAWWVGGRSNY